MTFSVTPNTPVKPSNFLKMLSAVLSSGKGTGCSLAPFSCPLSVAESVAKDFCLSLGLLFASSESELCSEEVSPSETLVYMSLRQ